MENANGLLKGFFPKGTDFSRATEAAVEKAFGLINDGLRKVLGSPRWPA